MRVADWLRLLKLLVSRVTKVNELCLRNVFDFLLTSGHWNNRSP